MAGSAPDTQLALSGVSVSRSPSRTPRRTPPGSGTLTPPARSLSGPGSPARSPASWAGHVLDSVPMVIKEGSLVKMGDSRFVLRTWAKRYFVLTQSSLTWLKNKQQEGSLKLDGVVRVNVLAPPAHYAAAQHKRAYFDIETARGQILHLAAASMEEASAWVIAISNSAFHYAQRLASRERKVNEIVSASASDSGRPRSASLNSAATFVSDWQNKVARNARERERQRKRAASGQLDTATRLFHTYIESEDVPLSAATLEALQELVSSEDVSSDMFDAAQREAEHLLRNSVLDAYHDECLNHVDGDALEFILSSPHHLEEFADFASKHDCEEVFNFYIEVENYRELPPDPEPDALSTDSSSSLWLPSPPLLSEILTDDEILQALLKYCRRHVSGALNDMMFVISADAFKRSLDPRHSARGRFEMARSIFDQFLRHRSARFVEVAPAIRESVETDLDEAEHFVVKLTIFDDAFRAVANRLQDRVLSGFYQSHHYHYILRERVGPPPARGSSAAEQRLRGLRIGPDSVDPKDEPDTPPATRDVFAPSRLQATFSKFVREVQANTKLRAAISAQYGPMDDDDGADDEADEEAEQQEQQRQKQEQQQQQQQQHQHEKETAAAYAAASSGRVRGDLRSRTLKPRRKKRRHRGSMDDIFAGLADTSTPPERQTSAPNPTDEPDAASSPVLAAVCPPSSRVAASGSAAGAGVFQPAAPPVRAASSHAPTSSRPRAQSELRAMPSAYTDRIPSAFSVLLGPGGKSSAQASGELQAVLQHIVMSDLFILHFLMEDLNFGRGYDMRTDELLPEELRELRQLTRAWRTTEFRDFVSTLVAILSTSNEAAIDLALRVLYITLDRKVHAGEDRGHVAPQERRKGRPATAMEDVMARLQCRHCVKVSELFVHYIKEYCSRKRFTLLIKNAVLTILLNDQRTLHLFPPARQRIAVFGASVRNPMAWPALWAGLRHAPVAIKVSTLNDVTSILVRRVLNLETLVGLPRWYAMLVPMLRPVSKMSSSSQKHQAAKVQIQDHLLSGLVLLQHHSLMKHNDFYMHLTESLCCLQEYWYNSVEALVIVQRCLGGLLDKIYAKRRLFPPSLERSAWTNLLRMVKLLRTYFLSTPMLGKSVHQNQEDGASGDKLPVWQHSRPRQLAGGVRFAPDIVSFGPHFSEQGQCTDIPIVAKSAKLLRALADEHNRHTRANMTAKELRRAQLLERESHYFYDLFSFLGALEKRRSTLTEMEISSLCSNFATGSSRQRTEVLRLLDSHTAFAPIILSAGSRVSERLRTRSVGALHGRSAPFRPTGVISFLKGSNVRRPLEPPHMSADESSSDLSSGEEDSDAERSDAEELSMLETEAELPDATSFVERMRQGSMGKFESSAFGFPTPRSARRSKSRSRLHQQLQRRQQQQQQQQRQTSPQTRPLRPEDSEPDADSDADSDAEASLTAQLLALEQPSPTASASCEAGTSANGGSPSTAPGHSIDDLSDMDHEEDDDIEWLEEAVRAAAEAAREIEAMEREQSVLAAKAAPRRSFIGRRAPQRAPILSGPPSSPKTRTSPASTPPPPTLPAGLVQPRLKHSTSGDVPSLFLSGTSSSTFRYTPPSSARRSSERHRMRSPSDS